MNASFSPLNYGRRWLLVLIIVACLAIPMLASSLWAGSLSTTATEQMQLAGPKEGFGG